MAVNRKTCLSAGIIIHDLLTSNAEVMKIAKKVFPVITDEAKTPYVLYRRTQRDGVPVKTGRPVDVTYIEVICYHSTYVGSVEMAEAVRSALDGVRGYNNKGLYMSQCTLLDSEEGWADGAYLQQMLFEIRM